MECAFARWLRNTRGYLRVPDTLECLARLAADGGTDNYAARLFGAA
jgi:hypothetical protein